MTIVAKRNRPAFYQAIRTMVMERIVGADASELEEGDTTAAVYAYTHDALCAGDLPQFGSPEWAVLPDDDPRKSHAVTLAALEFLNGEAAQIQMSHEIAEGMRGRTRRDRRRPSHAELVRSRATALESRPTQTAAQVAATARHSWASFERRLEREKSRAARRAA